MKNKEITSDNKQYYQILDSCRELFRKKLQDYGAAWRILRPSSVTDQIYIKVARIRSLQLTGENHVGESIESEFIGIVNYGIVGIIQFVRGFVEKVDITPEEAEKLYNTGAEDCIKIMEKKNHDYGEAWRNMRVETITDLILTKVFRTKQIEDNNGNTIASEGIAANYIDMVNYAIFALCLLNRSNQGQRIDDNGMPESFNTNEFGFGYIPTGLIDVEKVIVDRSGSPKPEQQDGVQGEGWAVHYEDSSMVVDMAKGNVSIKAPVKPSIDVGCGTIE